MKPTNSHRKTRRLRELNEGQGKLIAKGRVSLAEQDEILHNIIERNQNIKAVVTAVRNKN